MDDRRVRKAFALSLDRERLLDKFGLSVVRGGLVPPGMPGHSPDIALPFDVDLARRLMADAGFPEGKGFPAVKGLASGQPERLAEFAQHWRENLGVEVHFDVADPGVLTEWTGEGAEATLVINGWVADYPDPDNFLRQSDAIGLLRRLGWRDAAFDRLVEEAGRTANRSRRMAMYREADRILVAEQALLVPLFYNANTEFVKPWVKKQPLNLLGYLWLHRITIEEH